MAVSIILGKIDLRETVQNDSIYSIHLSGEQSNFFNEQCAIVNILSGHKINIATATGTFDNQGTMGMNLLGSHINYGTFSNTGKIVTSLGPIFSPNPLTGIGIIDPDGSLPVQGQCGNFGGMDCNVAGEHDFDDQTVWLSTADCIYGPNNQFDQIAYFLRELCSDSYLIARLNSITGPGWAGIMMRESFNVGAKKVQLMRNNTPHVRREVRYTENANAIMSNFPSFNAPWLKMERTGNTFRGFTSSNGVHWNQVLTTNIPMQECIKVGVVVSNYVVPGETRADFSDFQTVAVNLNLESNDNEVEALNLEMTTEKGGITVYPNPSNGVFQVNLSETNLETVQMNVFSAMGKQVKSMEIPFSPNLEMDLREFPTGIYYLQVLLDDGTLHTEKLVVEARP